MKTKNTAGIILVGGILLSFIAAFILKNTLLAILFSVLTFCGIMYKQKAALKSIAADKAYKKGELEVSFKLYEEACQMKECPIMVTITYAYRLITEGRLEESDRVLQMLDVDALTPVERLNYDATHALVIWKQGDPKRAVEIYETLLKDRESILIYETLGHLLNETEDYTKGIELSQKGSKLYPNNERIRCNLADSYYHQGEKKKAIKIYKTLIEDYALIPEVYYNYSSILESDGYYKRARKVLQDGLDRKCLVLYGLTRETMEEKIETIEEKIEESVVTDDYVGNDDGIENQEIDEAYEDDEDYEEDEAYENDEAYADDEDYEDDEDYTEDEAYENDDAYEDDEAYVDDEDDADDETYEDDTDYAYADDDDEDIS